MSQFEAKYDDFRAMGAEIAGISVESHFSNAAFRSKLGLRFPLLSDFNRQIAGEFAGLLDGIAVHYNRVNGRRILVVDRTLTVRWEWTASDPDEIPDTEPVREAVQDVVYA
ncbi:MAG: redoxin domain-containing protein [Actinomycetota bacterium]